MDIDPGGIEMEMVDEPSSTGHSRVDRQYSQDPSQISNSSTGVARRRPKLKRSISQSMKIGIADFFGVGDVNPREQMKWRQRSANHGTKSYLISRSKTMSSESDFNGHLPIYDPLAPPRAHRQSSRLSQMSAGRSFTLSHQVSRQVSTASSTGRRSLRYQPNRVSRKDSVAKMAYDGVKHAVAKTSSKKKRHPVMHSRSFTPSSISSYAEDFGSTRRSHTLRGSYEPPVAEMITSKFDKVKYRKEPVYLESTGDLSLDDSLQVDDVFFNDPVPTSPHISAFVGPHPPLPTTATVSDLEPIFEAQPVTVPPGTDLRSIEEGVDLDEDSGDVTDSNQNDKPLSITPLIFQPGMTTDPMVSTSARSHPTVVIQKPSPQSPEDYFESEIPYRRNTWRPASRAKTKLTRSDAVDIPDESQQHINLREAMKSSVSRIFSNSNRREIGKGVVGRALNRKYVSERMNTLVNEQLDEMHDHRPYFTYWVTFVQIMVYLIAVSVYGIAPIGFEETEMSSEVIKPNLAIEKVSYFEKDNMWIGPRQADLIHMGAKYSPCMRIDENVQRAMHKDLIHENKTACCIKNDGSGCVQASKDECSLTLSTWYKWRRYDSGPDGRISGTVCGQDPRWCEHPASAGAFKWPDDITKWPICTKKINTSENSRATEDIKHMTCEVVGRPCCVGIQGHCIITTREYCAFRNGYFHEEAALCSQISCMNEICGMLPFVDPTEPDQFYRLWTSLFLHAGALQLLVTVLFQITIMRDLEKLAGWLRIAIIYLGSGIAGSLSSAIFLPYYVEAGPAGSQFGLLACVFVELFQNWSLVVNPKLDLLKQSIFMFVLFIIGLLPMIDNYAHVVGFIVGLMLSFAFLPYVHFGTFDKGRKCIGIILCLCASAGLFAILVILFYVSPVYNCISCRYFNCLPFTDKFCQSMEVEITRRETY